MVLRNFYQKYENRIIAVGLLIILGAFIAWRYDYYFDLNDDVVMKDILSGVYTGEPESRNIQMMYPMSFVISLAYRIFPQAPVYGIFLCICQFGCLFLLVNRSLCYLDRDRNYYTASNRNSTRKGKSTVFKVVLAAIEGLTLMVLYLPHFVIIQYTITSAFLAGTAAFLFITSGKAALPGTFLKNNLWSIVLVILSFAMRSEMLLLALPLICVAGVYRWAEETDIFSSENMRKYLSVIGSILLSIVVVVLINKVGYGSKEWKSFMEYFDNRTELYDYQGLPPFEGNEELYERLGITESEQNMLFEQYNFGMDDALDAGILKEMAEHQADRKKQQTTSLQKLAGKFGEYRYRTFHKEPAGSHTPDDYPWNAMVILGYFSVLAAGLWGGRKSIGWKLLFLGAVRSVLWLYILMGERAPERITHSLYLLELCILWGMLHVESRALEGRRVGKVKAAFLFPAVILAASILFVKESVRAVDTEYMAREEANRTDSQMRAYSRNHEENFYFIDVYSFVSDPNTSTFYSEKLFSNTDNSIGNYDIMGGWVTKSPLYEKKLKAFGMNSMQEALVYDEGVYWMVELAKGTEFLEAYYKDQGIEIEATLIDTINGIVGVYKIEGYMTEIIADL